MLTPASSIAFIGFGDVGRRMAAPLARRGMAVRAYDSHYQFEQIEAAGVDPARTLTDALRGARLVIAAVSAHASRETAQSVAPLLSVGQTYLDLSDGATAAQQDNATWIESSGAHYVAGHAGVPLLLAGARASALAMALDAMGLPARAIAVLPQCCAPEGAATSMQGARIPDPTTAATTSPLRRGELP